MGDDGGGKRPMKREKQVEAQVDTAAGPMIFIRPDRGGLQKKSSRQNCCKKKICGRCHGGKTGQVGS